MNFGYLAVHRTAEVAKAIVRSYYGADANALVLLRLLERRPSGADGSAALPRRLRRHRRRRAGVRLVGIAAQFIKDIQAVFPIPARRRRCSRPDVLKSVEAQIVEKCDASTASRTA